MAPADYLLQSLNVGAHRLHLELLGILVQMADSFQRQSNGRKGLVLIRILFPAIHVDQSSETLGYVPYLNSRPNSLLQLVGQQYRFL